MKKKERYFGNPNTFAIRYIPGYITKDKNHYYAYCHLVLNGQIIGDKTESCFLSSWLSSFERLRDQAKNNFDSIKHPAFKNRSDREIFELIYKANQLPERYRKRYEHLPVLDNKVWVNCAISIDETTDAFLIAWVEAAGNVKFLWKGICPPCPPERNGKFFSIVVPREFVIESMENCVRTIRLEMKDYPVVEAKLNKSQTEFWDLIDTEVKLLPEVDQRKISFVFCTLVKDDLDDLGLEALQLVERLAVGRVPLRIRESYQKKLRKNLPSNGGAHPYSVLLWALESNSASYPAWYATGIAGSNVVDVRKGSYKQLITLVKKIIRKRQAMDKKKQSVP
jgi:hypothetical protein